MCRTAWIQALLTICSGYFKCCLILILLLSFFSRLWRDYPPKSVLELSDEITDQRSRWHYAILTKNSDDLYHSPSFQLVNGDRKRYREYRVYQMDKTQVFLPRERELGHLYLDLDVSTHGEAASVGEVPCAPVCISRFLSADMIPSYDWLTRCTHYRKLCWIISFAGRPHAFGWICSRQCPVVLIYSFQVPMHFERKGNVNIHTNLHINHKCEICGRKEG